LCESERGREGEGGRERGRRREKRFISCHFSGVDVRVWPHKRPEKIRFKQQQQPRTKRKKKKREVKWK